MHCFPLLVSITERFQRQCFPLVIENHAIDVPTLLDIERFIHTRWFIKSFLSCPLPKPRGDSSECRVRFSSFGRSMIGQEQPTGVQMISPFSA